MSKYYYRVDGGFIFHLPSFKEQEEIRQVWQNHTEDLNLSPQDLKKHAPDLFTMLIAYTRCSITLDKYPLGFSLDDYSDDQIIGLGVKIGRSEQSLIDKLESNVVDVGVEDIFTRSWWYRDKFQLTPNDPRFLSLTDYDISKEWYSSEAKALLKNYKSEESFDKYTVEELEDRLKAELKGEVPDSIKKAQEELAMLQQMYAEKQKKKEAEQKESDAAQQDPKFEQELEKAKKDYFDDGLWEPYEG